MKKIFLLLASACIFPSHAAHRYQSPKITYENSRSITSSSDDRLSLAQITGLALTAVVALGAGAQALANEGTLKNARLQENEMVRLRTMWTQQGIPSPSTAITIDDFTLRAEQAANDFPAFSSLPNQTANALERLRLLKRSILPTYAARANTAIARLEQEQRTFAPWYIALQLVHARNQLVAIHNQNQTDRAPFLYLWSQTLDGQQALLFAHHFCSGERFPLAAAQKQLEHLRQEQIEPHIQTLRSSGAIVRSSESYTQLLSYMTTFQVRIREAEVLIAQSAEYKTEQQNIDAAAREAQRLELLKRQVEAEEIRARAEAQRAAAAREASRAAAERDRAEAHQRRADAFARDTSNHGYFVALLKSLI